MNYKQHSYRCLMALAAALIVSLSGCTNGNYYDDGLDEITNDDDVVETVKNFTFNVKGDFGAAQFRAPAAPQTRASMVADGSQMTDLWILDYVGGSCVQSLHQTPDDADFGTPRMKLSMGSHHVYFIASRGKGATLDSIAGTITWNIVSDTFWKDYQIDVKASSNGNRAVTLERVATALRIEVDDEVPENIGTISITPDRWYYGLDYTTGEAVTAEKKTRSVDVPESFIGTRGTLNARIFGISGSDEWTTDVVVTATAKDGTIIGKASIHGAPFKRNRLTIYGGTLFGADGNMDISLNNEWDTPKTGSW